MNRASLAAAAAATALVTAQEGGEGGARHNVPVVDGRAAEGGELNRAPTCVRLCSGPGGRMGGPLFTARSLIM